jgi:hypothetical protein
VERIWGVRGGRGSSKQGVPRWRKNRAAGSDGGGTEEQPSGPKRFQIFPIYPKLTRF